MTKIANRRSPSGPQIALQMPFYGTQGVSGASNYAPIGAGAAVAALDFAQYMIPLGNSLPGSDAGNLDMLEIKNSSDFAPAPTDTQSTTYKIFKNGVDQGHSVSVPNNNTTDFFPLDLSDIAVVKGDLIAIQVICPVLIGTNAPASIFLSWLPQGNI